MRNIHQSEMEQREEELEKRARLKEGVSGKGRTQNNDDKLVR